MKPTRKNLNKPLRPKMKVDFSTQILDFKGKPIPVRDEDGKLEADKFITLGDIAAMALGSQYEDEKHLDGREKNKRFRLGLVVLADEQPQEITVDDAAEIKKLIAKGMAPLHVGRAWEIIEAAAKSEPLKLVEGESKD